MYIEIHTYNNFTVTASWTLDRFQTDTLSPSETLPLNHEQVSSQNTKNNRGMWQQQQQMRHVLLPLCPL